MISRCLVVILNFLRLYRKNAKIKDLDKISVASSISNCTFEHGVLVAARASLSAAKVGKYSSIGRNTKITNSEIGRFCAISWDCTINAVFHPMDRLTVHAFPYVPDAGGFVSQRRQAHKSVIIGHDVWVGAQAIIMPGVRIGHGAIIGAGSVVTRDVEPYEIVCGNPARHLKWRFDKDCIDALLSLKWWEWDDDRIQKSIEFFQVSVTKELIDNLRARF